MYNIYVYLHVYININKCIYVYTYILCNVQVFDIGPVMAII